MPRGGRTPRGRPREGPGRPAPRGGRLRRAAALALLLAVPAGVLPSCTDPARLRFEAAEKAFQERRMDDALAGYRSITREYPESRYAPAALLRQGDLYGSWYRNAAAALEAYDSLAFNYPRAAELPRASLKKAEIRLIRFSESAAAAEDLEALRRRYPRFEGMDEVLALLGKAYAGMSDPARELAALRELLEGFPDSPRAREARWRVGYVLLGTGRFADAEREFQKMLYLAADPKEAARARWGVAHALEGQGRYAEALGEYEAIGGEGEDPAYIAGKVARLRKIVKASRAGG